VLDNARRHAQRQRVAAALERALLPAVLPEIPGADVAALYRPAGSASVVGGDFYDVFAVAEDEWAILVGDVSGRGPEAAALTGIARYTVRAVAADMMRPSEVLTELNGALLRGRVAERFCTALFAHVRCAGGRLDISIASAGHPSPLLLCADGTVRCALQRTGTLLGVFDSVEMHDETVTLTPGDSLVAYSDGVIDARDGSRQLFGEERLRTLLGSCTGRSADGIVRRVERAVRDHVGNERGDDVVLLALRAVGA
jgi:sigma-B regulation protein RsbU (phosphoserine phosphatase)